MEATEPAQGPKGALETGAVICDCASRKIIIRSYKRILTYVPIINQVHLSARKTGQPGQGDCLEYLVQSQPKFSQELGSFSCCVLVLNQGSLCHILGEYRNSMGREVRRPYLPNYSPVKNSYCQQQRRVFSKSELIPNTSRLSVVQTEQRMKGSILMEANQKECHLYVTKFRQKIDQEVYQTNMFHQYLWQEQEIEFLMAQIHQSFGEFHALAQKRRHLKFTFRRPQADSFWQPWQHIHNEILLSEKTLVHNGIITYYIWSKQCQLTNEQLTNTLFQLPNNSRIVDFCLADPWAVIAAENYVLFINIEKPMEHFRHYEKMAPSRVYHVRGEQAVIILDKQGKFYSFKFRQQDNFAQKTFVTPFLKPYCMVEVKDGVYLAGLDVHRKDSHKACLTRKIYKLAHNISTIIEASSLELERTLEVITLPKHMSDTVISHIVAPSKDLLACTCGVAFYLLSVSGQRLIEVQLKSPITCLFPVPFLFNLYNFVLLNSEGQMVRLGVELYGQTLGSEVQRLSSGIKDCRQWEVEGVKWQVVASGGKEVVIKSYLKEEWRVLVRQQKGEIIRIGSDGAGVAFLVDLQHSYQLRYLEV